MPTPSARERFTALDWIAVVLAAGGALVLIALAPVGGSFAAMHAHFGADLELPLLTRCVTSAAGPLVLAAPPIAALATGLRARDLGARRVGIVVAFVLALAGIALCFVGYYLPLWEVAGAIRAE